MARFRGDDTAPTERVFELFLEGEPVGERVRPAILRSWRRCRSAGLDPEKLDFSEPVEVDFDSVLVRAARPVFERLRPAIADADVTMVLLDEQARMLLRYESDPQLARVLDRTHALPGVGYAEESLGTTAGGTPLLEKRMIHVSGFEHLARCVQPFSATGVPILDPLTGHARGVVTIACLYGRAHPAMDVLARQAAEAIERRLLEQSTARERALFEAFLRAGDVPSLLPSRKAGPLLADLGRADRLLLEERAAELIAHGQRAAVEVPLSRGRVATLRSLPRTGTVGVVGVVAQVRIQDGPWEPLAEVAVPPAPALLPGPPATPRTALDAAAARAAAAVAVGGAPAGGEREASTRTGPGPDPGPDQGLFLLGEPGVGRIAASARKRLRLLCDAALSIGRTLDVVRTAEELTEATVPFADLVTVDLDDCVVRGEESCPTAGSLDLRRVAALGVHGSVSPVAVGEPVHYIASSPQARCLSDQQALLWRGPDIAGASGGPSSGTGFSSGIAVPLLAHGMAMGLVTFTRTASSGPFEDEDAWLAEELARRTALCLDNARRFTRERAMVRALRRSLLPWNLPEQNAVEAAHCYMPARSGTSGDWYDVIPLSGARVALVVGEQCGRGPHSTAAMGRLRTTVGNFSALDMPPGDILGYLDDLVRGLDRESAGRAAQAGGEADGGTDAGADDGVTGTTCVYAVYDPASQRCTIASAGHPAPALVRPDGAVEFLEVPAGEPLGRGGPVFETAEVDLPEGSTIVLYTKGLIGEHAPPGQGGDRERLRRALTGAGRTAEQTCSALLDALPSGRMPGEFTVLAARTRALPRHCVAEWEVPPDPAAVGRIRDEVARRLAEWNLEELTFSAELIFSELVTNAIRYGSEPLGARLLLDRSLICEVSDAGETAPRPRRAADTDEGGRGLYLVAQLAERWGTRYTRRGKIIWAELPLGDGGCEPGAVPRPG